jgi:nucleotide-binding universal stress UspA family protein
MSKLLVAVDGSPNATRAVEYAIRLAKKTGDALHLVTVHPEPVIYGEIQVYVPKEKMEELQRKHSEDFLKPAVELVRAAGIVHTSEILIGDTAVVIAQRGKELACESIVMGTSGMGTIATLIMGSVATKVVHLSELPVTLVK